MRHTRARALRRPLALALLVIVALSVAGFFLARSVGHHDEQTSAVRRARTDRDRAEILLERANRYVVGLAELLASEPTATQKRFAFLAATTLTSFDLLDALWIERTGGGLVVRYGTTVAPGTDLSGSAALATPILRQGTVFAATATRLGSLHGIPGFWLLQSGRFGRAAGRSGYLAVFIPEGWMTLSLQDDAHAVEVLLDGRRLDGTAGGSTTAAANFVALGQAWQIRADAPARNGLEVALPWLALAWPWAAGLLMLLIANAIVRRRRAEREAERIFDFSLDMLAVASHDGFLVHVNPAFTHTLGYTAAELTSRPFLDFVVEEDRARTTEAFDQLLRGQDVVQFENRYRCRDGSVCWLEWSVRAVRPQQLLYAAARDITARREAEERVRETELDLRASRARVVAAADETRRQIERDLHDGTQQRLVALALALRVAESHVPAQEGELRERISAVAEGLALAVSDLQEFSRGIHPSIVTRGGLDPALRALARRSTIPVDLETHIEGRIDTPVEVAVYYLVSEALTNAAKHSQATRIAVRAHMATDRLEVTIADDGVGGADAARGSGLLGLFDRVQAIGGSLEVESEPKRGTTLRASFPLEPAGAEDGAGDLADHGAATTEERLQA